MGRAPWQRDGGHSEGIVPVAKVWAPWQGPGMGGPLGEFALGGTPSSLPPQTGQPRETSARLSMGVALRGHGHRWGDQGMAEQWRWGSLGRGKEAGGSRGREMRTEPGAEPRRGAGGPVSAVGNPGPDPGAARSPGNVPCWSCPGPGTAHAFKLCQWMVFN